MIKLMGERIDNTDSVYYWAARNDIPVFCPAITDGSVLLRAQKAAWLSGADYRFVVLVSLP